MPSQRLHTLEACQSMSMLSALLGSQRLEICDIRAVSTQSASLTRHHQDCPLWSVTPDFRYIDTPVFTGHAKDARQQKLAQSKAKRDAEKALLNLAARSEPQSDGRQAKAGDKLASNPFLASPERPNLYVSPRLCIFHC